MNKKLLFRLGLLFGFVLLISAAVIYFTFDIRTLEYLTMFEPRCILLALSCLAIGLIFDGLRLITLASVTDEKLRVTRKWIIFPAAGVPPTARAGDAGVTWISAVPCRVSTTSTAVPIADE